LNFSTSAGIAIFGDTTVISNVYIAKQRGSRISQARYRSTRSQASSLR
jgi:hypothetical protein